MTPAEQLARQIVQRNAEGRSRASAAQSSVLDAIKTGAVIDVDELFRGYTADDAAERDGASGATGTAQPVGGDIGGATAGA